MNFNPVKFSSIVKLWNNTFRIVDVSQIISTVVCVSFSLFVSENVWIYNYFKSWFNFSFLYFFIWSFSIPKLSSLVNLQLVKCNTGVLFGSNFHLLLYGRCNQRNGEKLVDFLTKKSSFKLRVVIFELLILTFFRFWI